MINTINFSLTCFFINYQKYFLLFYIRTDEIVEKQTGENKSKEDGDVAEEEEEEAEEEAEEEEAQASEEIVK